MEEKSPALAVLLRQVLWDLDDAAFDLGAGRSSAAQRRALAERLAKLADKLRAVDDNPLIIDQDE